MNILVITQKVDEEDSILGFMHTWINRLAENLDRLYVITGFIGKTNLPNKVELYSLGKEKNFNKFYHVTNFIKHMTQLVFLNKISLIFIHMCPEYAILTWFYAKLKKIPVIMWYAHGNTNLKLRIAHLLVGRAVTSSKDGFRLKSNKVIITGQGIDIDKFKVPACPTDRQNLEFKVNGTKRIILSVGRISPIKNYETLIKAADILVNQKNIKDLKFQIVGSVPFKSQERYLDFLKDMVREYKLQNCVQFVGPIPYTQIQCYYQNCDLFVSTSNTGSLDKIVLEAMACEKIVLTCNEAFRDVLGNHSENLIFGKRNALELTEKVSSLLQMDEESQNRLGLSLRNTVVENHNLDRLIGKLITIFKSLTDSIKKD